MKLTLIVLSIFLAIASFSSLLSPAYWFFDLFNHFRVQVVIASIILWGISFIFDKRNFIFTTSILIGNIVLFMIPLLQTNANISEIKSDSIDKIIVVFSNVNSSNTNYSLIENVLLKDNPDIIVLCEVTPQLTENLKALRSIYPHTLELSRSDNFGLAIYSKPPFKARIKDVGLFKIPLVELNFKGYDLVVAHPFPPISELGLQENKTYLETIANISISSEKPLIVVGDFNSTLWGDALKPLIQAGFKRANRIGVGFTWPYYFPFFAMQIDHIFVRDSIVSNFKILENIGSDHYPIQAIVGIPSSKTHVL